MDLDLHYGDGFELFHETLLETKLLTTNKGISLLNGKPGTGKTYYINRLIYDLKKTSKKKIILVPANMVSYILEPEFNTFLLDIVNSFHFDYDDEEIELEDEEIDEIKEGIILILEDAEPILMKREMSGNSQATSNILNLTDGLLNNIFKIQIIATYNTDDNNIDKAILRDKRLVAKRTFNELSLDDTIRLMKHLGFETEGVDKGMTLAQIYSVDDTEIDSILIESKNKEKNKNKSNTYL
jgi:SpoVK/Ycf46/Vps4 family AAA+-type ATPase